MKGVSRKSSGMTLVELIAALAITGFAIVGALELIDGLTESGARIAALGVARADTVNGERVLRRLLAETFVTRDSTDAFRGDSRTLEFTTRCEQPEGWLQRCRVVIVADRRSDTSAVIASSSTGGRLELLRRVGAAEFRYFNSRSPDSTWTSRWAAPLRTPEALGVIVAGDTTVFPIGASRD